MCVSFNNDFSLIFVEDGNFYRDQVTPKTATYRRRDSNPDLQSTNFVVAAYFTQGDGIRKLVYMPMLFLQCFYAKLIALKSIFSN